MCFRQKNFLWKAASVPTAITNQSKAKQWQITKKSRTHIRMLAKNSRKRQGQRDSVLNYNNNNNKITKMQLQFEYIQIQIDQISTK